LRKAWNIVVSNINISNSFPSSDNSSLVTNNSNSFENSSTNNFAELEHIENNDRTLKELATPDVVYQPWCIQPQGILEDYIKMKAFPFSMDKAAKDWLYL
ncbi:hypothetical protein CR513_19870, partial [Mucuna pruriens]